MAAERRKLYTLCSMHCAPVRSALINARVNRLTRRFYFLPMALFLRQLHFGVVFNCLKCLLLLFLK